MVLFVFRGGWCHSLCRSGSRQEVGGEVAAHVGEEKGDCRERYYRYASGMDYISKTHERTDYCPEQIACQPDQSRGIA